MAEPPAAAPTDEDRLAGVLVGTAIGDALGLPTENLSPRRLAKLFPPPLRHRFLPGTGMVSDDTEHAALSALSLLDAPDDPRAFARQLAWRLRFWLASLPAGVGMATARACIRLWLGFSPEKSGVFSGGNGPSMRLRAVSTEAFWAEPLASLEAHLARGASVHELASALGLSRGVTGYSMHSVPVALYAWLRHRPDFPAALDAAICCGGDTDSVGAVVGALAGSCLGARALPAAWRDGIRDWPWSTSRLHALGAALARSRSGTRARAPLTPWPLVVCRNLFFLTVVLLHGFRRLLPPY